MGLQGGPAAFPQLSPVFRFRLPEREAAVPTGFFLSSDSLQEIPGRGCRSGLGNPLSRALVPWATDVDLGWGLESMGRGRKGCGRCPLGSGATESITRVCPDIPRFHTQAYTPTPTFLLSGQWGESVGSDFSSLMETLILAIWKRVSRADNPEDPLASSARC